MYCPRACRFHSTSGFRAAASLAFQDGEAAICYDYGEITSAGKKGHATKLKIVSLDWLYGR